MLVDDEGCEHTPEEIQARDHNLVQLGCRITYPTLAARRGPLDVGPRFDLPTRHRERPDGGVECYRMFRQQPWVCNSMHIDNRSRWVHASNPK